MSMLMSCLKCRQQNYAQLCLEVPLAPMHFIAMDLIAKLKPSLRGHQYALMVIDMLPNYTWCMSVCTEETNKVVHSYLVNIHFKFGGSHKIMLDNGTEFRNNILYKLSPC